MGLKVNGSQSLRLDAEGWVPPQPEPLTESSDPVQGRSCGKPWTQEEKRL